MKVLYHHRIASRDGQYVHIESLTGALAALGHDVVIVGPGFADAGSVGADSRLIVFLKRYVPRALYELIEFAYNLRDYFRLAHAIRVHRPDFIYERYNLYLLSGVWARRRFRLPLISEVNAPLFDERNRYGGIALKRLAAATERAAWRGADCVVTVTNVLRDRIIDEGIPVDKVVVTPNGVDLDRFPVQPSRDEAKRRLGLEGALVLGFTGFARDWHGLDRVVDLLAAARERNLCFLLVGDGDVRPALEKKARELGVAGRLRITGFVERDAIPAYVRAFDVALQPAVVDYASPLKLFEYMACASAIVAPAKANIREILTAGDNALLFDPVDPAQFVAAVARLCADAPLRARLGAAARRTLIERDLTWAHNARTVMAIAHDLAVRPVVAAAAPLWRKDHV
jgi:glycosyltransferase involved in cell wall biosynthesis